MFGKPHWFRAKRLGWGLVPVRWQGWVYALAWAAMIGLPFIWLVERHQGLEAIIWMTASLAVLVWDVREILQAMSADEPMYIGPEESKPVHSVAGGLLQWLRRTMT